MTPTVLLILIRRGATFAGAAARGLWDGWKKKEAEPEDPISDPTLPAGWTYADTKRVQKQIDSATTLHRVTPPPRKERK